jgi:hypothetical protein
VGKSPSAAVANAVMRAMSNREDINGREVRKGPSFRMRNSLPFLHRQEPVRRGFSDTMCDAGPESFDTMMSGMMQNPSAEK